MALIVTTFLWGKKYGVSDLAKLSRGLRRHLKEPFRFICLTDDLGREPVEGVDYRPIVDGHLTKIEGCLARLRLFDPTWQFTREIIVGDRIVSIDLDVVVTGSLDALFCRPDTFMILTGANASNPCPYNGSIFMLRAGSHTDVWHDFTLEAATAVRHAPYADDQSWFAHKIPGVTGWKVGPQSGIYAFKKPEWHKGDDLPKDARLVVFPGWRSPEQFKHLPWIAANWS